MLKLITEVLQDSMRARKNVMVQNEKHGEKNKSNWQTTEYEIALME